MNTFNALPNLIKLAAPTQQPTISSPAKNNTSGFGFSLKNPTLQAGRQAATSLKEAPNLKQFGAGLKDKDYSKVIPSFTIPKAGPFSNIEISPFTQQKSVFNPKADYYGQFQAPVNMQNPYNQDTVDFIGPRISGNF